METHFTPGKRESSLWLGCPYNSSSKPGLLCVKGYAQWVRSRDTWLPLQAYERPGGSGHLRDTSTCGFIFKFMIWHLGLAPALSKDCLLNQPIDFPLVILIKIGNLGNSLAVQWVGLRTSTAESRGSVPGWGTKIPQAEGRNKNKWNGNYSTIASWV